MARYLKLIWFIEDDWTKYHAAIGINAETTLCGIWRSSGGRASFLKNRAILPSEKLLGFTKEVKCLNCLAILKRDYNSEDVKEVKVG